MGKRFAAAGAITATVALAGIVGTSTASAIPPKGVTVPGLAVAAPAPQRRRRRSRPSSTACRSPCSRPRRPIWVFGEVWVESNFDSDGDGKLDRMHTNFTIPKETQTDGLKVPVIYRGQPVLRGHRRSPELSRRPRARRSRLRAEPRSSSAASSTSPDIDNDLREHRGCRAATASCTPSRPAPATPTAARPPAGPTRRRAPTVVIDWLNGRRKAYTTRTGTVEAAPVTWHNGKTAMMGTSYNGTIPVAAATTGVEGLDGDRPDLRDLRLVRLLPRQRHGPRAALRRPAAPATTATWARISTCWPTSSTRAATSRPTRPAARSASPSSPT